jgi:Na+/glutamate symporter
MKFFSKCSKNTPADSLFLPHWIYLLVKYVSLECFSYFLIIYLGKILEKRTKNFAMWNLKHPIYQLTEVTGGIITFLVSYSHSINKYFLFNLKKEIFPLLIFLLFLLLFFGQLHKGESANGLVVVTVTRGNIT